jgi:hypothetical protein
MITNGYVWHLVDKHRLSRHPWEYGEEASSVILGILDRERFDLVVMGNEGEGHRREDREGGSEHESGHVAARVAQTTACKVVTCSARTALSADVAGRQRELHAVLP